MARLSGKRALVTGGGRGIGAGVALRLAQDGADVAITYHKTADGAEAIAQQIRDLGRRSVAIAANAAEAASAETMVRETVRKLGGLDFLILNSGVANVGLLDELTEAQIQEMLDVNVRASILGARAALAHLPKGGRIIFVGSALADRVFAGGLAAYAMTKTALGGFTRGLARELGPRDINVNIVHPGNTYSDMNPRGSEQNEYLASLTALGRYNEPSDIGAAISFLCSDDARQITGAALNVDAGMNC